MGCHSVCLATQLPSSSPLQNPITFHAALLQFTKCCEKEAPRTYRQTEETKEKEDKEDKVEEEEDSGEFGFKT